MTRHKIYSVVMLLIHFITPWLFILTIKNEQLINQFGIKHANKYY